MSDYYAAKQCQLKLFGNTVKSILEANDLRDRDLDVVELWSGVGSIVKAARNHVAVPFDINRRPGVTDLEGPGNEDITSPAGFNKALDYVLRLRPSGLLFMAPVCSSFSFCNMHNTKRNRDNVRVMSPTRLCRRATSWQTLQGSSSAWPSRVRCTL